MKSVSITHMKNAIVTGATSDIGAAIIRLLLQANYNVVAIGRNDQALADLESLSPNITALKTDLSHTESVLGAIAYLRNKMDKVDTIIHCAGVWHDEKKPLANTPLQDFSNNEILDTISVGLTSFILIVRAVIPKMVAGSSSIIAISGTFENGGKGWIPYFVSKRGLEDFMIALSDELKDTGITVNTVSPSDTATKAYQKFFPEYIDESIDPSEIAKKVQDLLSTKETGKTYVVKLGEQIKEKFHA